MIILIGENDCAPSEVIGLFRHYEDIIPILESFKKNKEYKDRHGNEYSFDKLTYTSMDIGQLNVKFKD